MSGYETESRLHQAMRAFVRPDTSFHDLYEFANEQIREEGFENLDFLGNVGPAFANTETTGSISKPGIIAVSVT